MKDARHGKDQPEGQAQRRIGPPPVIAWFHQHLSACEPLALAGRDQTFT